MFRKDPSQSQHLHRNSVHRHGHTGPASGLRGRPENEFVDFLAKAQHTLTHARTPAPRPLSHAAGPGSPPSHLCRGRVPGMEVVLTCFHFDSTWRQDCFSLCPFPQQMFFIKRSVIESTKQRPRKWSVGRLRWQCPGAPAISLPPLPPGVGGLSSHSHCCLWQIFRHRTRSLEQQSPEDKSKIQTFPSEHLGRGACLRAFLPAAEGP